MWTELKTEEELAAFTRLVGGFHDSVLKELSYVSGAYVDEELSMHPVDDKACLRVLIQRQDETLPALELEFSGLQELRLYPTDPSYTSEILDAALFLRDGLICWCDCGDTGPENFDDYRGTSVSAKSLRWRPIAGEQEKGAAMKRKKLLILLICALAFFAFCAYGVYSLFFDIQRIKGQEKMRELSSPDGQYTVIAYLNNGGATTNYAVLCAVKNNQTGRTRNIYWNYPCWNAEMTWLDEHTVTINGIALDVRHDTFDYRNP